MMKGRFTRFVALTLSVGMLISQNHAAFAMEDIPATEAVLEQSIPEEEPASEDDVQAAVSEDTAQEDLPYGQTLQIDGTAEDVQPEIVDDIELINEAAPREEGGLDDTVESGDFTYTTVSGGIRITKYSGSATNLSIPSTIDELTVLGIGSSTFADNIALVKVVIPDTVTYIDYNAFRGCTSLQSVTLSSSLESIGSSAFDGCTSLRSLTIPATVKNISSQAFTSLESITFESGMEKLSSNACSGATNLVSVSLPATLTEIGSSAFYNCSLLSSISIPSGVTSIGSSAFYNCSSITALSLPGSLKTIGGNAFQGATSLEALTIPATVTSIGSSAFASVKKITFANGTETIVNSACQGASNLETVIIPAGVTSIGNYAFKDCKKLESISLTSDIASIGTGAFQYCEALTGITIPNSVASIPNYCFSGCSVLAGVTFSNSLTSIGNYAFNQCTSLTSVRLYDGLTGIGTNAFYGCTSLATLVLPGDLVSIGNNAFEQCSSLASITIPNSVTSLGTYVFAGCSELSGAVLPTSITTIPSGLFKECLKLTTISIPSGVTSIGDYAFCRCSSITALTLSDSITKIGSNAFYDCDLLTTVNIPASLTQIGSNAFGGKTAVNEVTIPTSLTSIGSGAFGGVKKITFADEIVNLPDSVCNGSSSLEAVVLPSSLTSIGRYAFNNCRSLATITLSDGLTSIGDYAFQNCTSLTDFVMPNTVTTIGTYLFSGCSSLENVTLSTQLTAINAKDFYSCTSLSKITIPASVTSIGENAFYGCRALSGTMQLADGVSAGNYAFQGCSTLQQVKVGNDAVLGKYTFSDCSGLEEIILGDRVSIGDYCFNSCTALKSIKLGKDIVYGKDCFRNVTISGSCGTDLTYSLSIDDSVLQISGTGAMTDYSLTDPAPWSSFSDNIKTVFMEDGITSVGAYAFYDLKNIPSVVFPESVMKVGEYALYSCDSLDYVEFPEKIKAIEGSALADCKAISRIVFSGDAPRIAEDFIENIAGIKILIPETASGFTTRILSYWDLVTWEKWDNTVPTKDIILLLDHSGSMSGKMDTLKQSANAFVDGIGGRTKNTRIAVIQYDDRTDTLISFSTDINGIKAKINKMTSNGGTEYLTALKAADALMKQSRADMKSVIMFSDGEPNDSTDSIYAYAETMGNSYVMYSVGLLSSDNQRQVLINVAGSETRYFEATDINSLLAAFLQLMENFGKKPHTTAKMKRWGVWEYVNEEDAQSEQIFSKSSPEEVYIEITVGTDYKDKTVSKYAFLQNGQEVSRLTGTTGAFTFSPGELFNAGDIISIAVYFSDGTSDIKKTNIRINDKYKITFNLNDENSTVLETQEVKNGTEIERPDDPKRDGYVFDDWYASEEGEGLPFFDSLIDKYRLAGDLTLYAHWKKSQIDWNRDIWGFGNYGTVFCTSGWYSLTDQEQDAYHYDITDADKEKLLSHYFWFWDRGRLKNMIENDSWGGSCFGMSESVVLALSGNLSISNFVKGATKLKAVTSADMDLNSVSNVESMINYYFFHQNIKDVERIVLKDYDKNNESKNMKRIVETMKNTSYPVALGLTLYEKSTHNVDGGHEVVAYDLNYHKGKGEYTFNVYDCSIPSAPFEVTVNAGTYEEKCDAWEAAWSNGIGHPVDIFLETALTVDQMKTLQLLNAPSANTDSLDEAATDAIPDASETNAGSYEMTTSFGDFSISCGEKEAVVSGGENISGELSIVFNGTTHLVEQDPSYSYTLPVLDGSGTYTIKPADGTTGQKLEFFFADEKSGFYTSVRSEGSDTVVLKSTGAVETQSSKTNNQQIYVSSSAMNTSWYTVQVKGASRGFSVTPGEKTTSVTSLDDANVSITAGSDLNYHTFENISIGNSGIDLSEVGDKIEVIKDGTVVQSGQFGYSVLFDSQGGTSYDALTGVAAGTKLDEPVDPVRDGSIFTGWYKNDACTDKWDFGSDTVTADTVLYAGWGLDPNFVITVTFKLPDSTERIIYTTKGARLKQEECPSLAGYKDKNWYTDSEHTNAWDFDTVLTKSMVLYALGGETEDIPVSSVTLEEHDLTMGIKEEYKLAYTIEPRKAANKNVSWTSSDPSVVTVSDEGVLTAIKIGEATITVTTEDGSKTDSCRVVVEENNPTGISLVAGTTSYTLLPGEVRRLSISPTSQYIYDVRWTAGDTKIVTVKNGVVTAKKAGTTTVTAVYGTSSVTFDIIVDGTTPKNTAIQDGNKKYKITATKSIKTTVGKNKTVSVSIPANLRNASKTVRYKILTDGVCSVSGPSYNKPDRTKASKAKFRINPLDAGATWIIWSMEDDFGETTQAATKVIITKPVTGLAFAETDVTLNVGEGKRLVVTDTENNTDSKELSFSANGKGVKVSKSGYVVGVVPGSKVTVTVKSGKIKATIPVTVSSCSGDYLTIAQNSVNVALPKSGSKTVPLKLATSKKGYKPKVAWSVFRAPEGISIDPDGRISVSASASPGCYVITAEPEDTSAGLNPAYCELIVK